MYGYCTNNEEYLEQYAIQCLRYIANGNKVRFYQKSNQFDDLILMLGASGIRYLD